MQPKKTPVISIVFYVLAGLLAAYTVWALISTQQAIAKMLADGQLEVSGNVYNIASYFMSNCAQYLVYAFVLFGLGKIMCRKNCKDMHHQDAIVTETPAVVVEETTENKE